MTAGLEAIGTDTGRGHSVTTPSGLPFWPMDPRPEDIRLEDIAHSLSLQCRFNGATRSFYSVAQHCVLMALELRHESRELAREALLHDAAETYVGDLVRPVKAHCPDWCAIDARVDAAVRKRFGLPEQMTEAVRHADVRMVVTERRDLLNLSPGVDRGDLPDPYERRIIPVAWDEAKRAFLEMAIALGVE